MQNILLIAALEGTQHQVSTDWFAIVAMLKARELSEDEINRVYNELCAGLRVTTRGVTLAKQSANELNKKIIKHSENKGLLI
ncbi:hypothetical protein [Shewanella sp. OMA3-2]|uniref:hypothetical protein n=1 Tax=Shewanella sp. OMA3-2 TaxID=2908650 RepID=UPI001F1C57AA|nr:hypothetical protein [Shewanella sp. OMA3-2]UJF22866.1 hypothetical protein L0B17_05640 [Shewanella sp. OMA3-2]